MKYAEKDLTPWFQGDIRPARVGVYQRNYREEIPGDFGVLFCYWDGEDWWSGERQPELAKENLGHLGPTLSQSLPWRGLMLDALPTPEQTRFSKGFSAPATEGEKAPVVGGCEAIQGEAC